MVAASSFTAVFRWGRIVLHIENIVPLFSGAPDLHVCLAVTPYLALTIYGATWKEKGRNKKSHIGKVMKV